MTTEQELEQIVKSQTKIQSWLKWGLALTLTICGLTVALLAITVPIGIQMHTSIEDLQQKWEGERGEKVKLEGELHQIKEDNSSLLLEFQSVQEEVGRLRVKVATLTQQNDSLQRDKDRLLTENARLLSQVQELTTTNIGYQNQLQALIQAKAEGDAQAGRQIEQLQKDIRSNQQQVESALGKAKENFDQLRRAEWVALVNHVVFEECKKRIVEKRSDSCENDVRVQMDGRRESFDKCFSDEGGSALYFEGKPSTSTSRTLQFSRGFVDFCDNTI